MSSIVAAEVVEMTDAKTGLSSEQVDAARTKYGMNEIPIPETPLYMLFLYQFTGFLPYLIELAGIVALAIQEWIDFAIIAAMLLINGLLGFREEYIAKKSLDEITNCIESEVTVRRNGDTMSIATKELVPGDIILLVGGTVIPADTKWISGDNMQIDTAAMTGEPIPRKYPSSEHGDVILSGTTVVAGECYGQVLRTGVQTEMGKAQQSILNDKSVRVVSVFYTKIMTVVQILVTSCLALVISVLLVEGIAYDGFTDNASGTVLDALSIMIASIPIALPLVLQVNMSLGASFMAKEHHAVVTSIPALQDIASMSMLCSDKTGTLTTANMTIILNRTFAAEGFTVDDVILYAYLCSNKDKKDDPIDSAIVSAFTSSSVAQRESEFVRKEIIGFNPNVKRVISFVEVNGKIMTIAKGLPAKCLDTNAGGVDDHELQWKVDMFHNKAFLENVHRTDEGLSKTGYKTIGVAVCEGDARQLENPTWKFVGLLPMLDPPRADTADTINSLHHANISVKMITGDHVNVGKETARLIGLGTDIRAGEEIRNCPSATKKKLIWEADGFAAVLPSDKREAVMVLRNDFQLVVGMTGDGVNDAPALSAAQVGIAVAGATDAAKNAADLILTEQGLSPIYGAVLESRRIFARIKSYVVYRVAASITMALTLSIIIFATSCAVDSLLVIILALMNDISMIPVAYDRASATTKPQVPNAAKIVLQSMFYGLTLTLISLVFIFGFSYGSNLSHPIDLDECDPSTQSFVWFHLVVVSELAIFSVRSPSLFFLNSPAISLISSVLLTIIGCALIAVFASDLDPENLGIILAVNVSFLLFVDILKLWFRRLIKDDFGDTIESDDLIPVDAAKTETQKHVEKGIRYAVHRSSTMKPKDMGSVVILVDKTGWKRFFCELRSQAVHTNVLHRQKLVTMLHDSEVITSGD